MSARKAAILTLGVVVGLALVAAAVVAFVVVYGNASDRADDEAKRARSLESDKRALVRELTTANARARSEYSRGYGEGGKAERDTTNSLGLTYGAGYREGWKAVFAGFDGGWQDGGWYMVKIDHGQYGHMIKSRFDELRPCERVYVSNEHLYEDGFAC
jgi:hypothetical protein